MALEPGQQFGRYELMFRLGHGGMAETWRARLLGEAGVTKPVLIKKVLPEYANGEAFTTMFVSEARISATLSHGNIAQVYDFGRLDDEYFLAMEFVDGQPLHRIIKRALRSGLSFIPVPLATFIGIEMCRGLHYAHTRLNQSGKPLGIVHRDISPDNVLVSYEGQVKIVDFGIAKARELRGFNTEPGVVKGKFLFFSPEQARGEEVDARTDVWATGIVLYELLCGKLPVQGPEYAAIPRLMRGEFPRPRQLNPELPEELEDVLMRALAVRREERYESSHAFGDALAGFLYTAAPRFSGMTLSHFVQELFREDLGIEGRTVKVPPSFLEQLALWRGEPRADAPLPAPQARKAPAPGTARTLEPGPVPTASPPSRAMWKWGAGGAALTLLICGALFAFVGEGTQTPHRPGDRIDVNSAGERPPPVQTKAVPAKQAYRDAYLLFQKKDYNQAAARALECLNLDPANAECQLLAGEAYASLGQTGQAERHYTSFLKLDPQHEAAPRVGKLLLRYEQEAAAAPPKEPAPTPTRPLEMAAQQPERPKPPFAESTPSSEALRRHDELIWRANADAMKGRYPSAVARYREALDLKPGSLEAREGLGYSLVLGSTGASDYREGVKLLEDVVKAKDVNPRAWFALGLGCQLTQRNTEAVGAYRQYLTVAPGGKFASFVRQSLNQLERR
jgi:serine/threonine-protein kinase